MSLEKVIDILNDSFEADILESTDIDESEDFRQIKIYGQTTNALDIIRNDPEMFREIKNTWMDDVKFESAEYISSVEDILQNKYRILDLMDSSRESRIIPFVGSGMSSDSGFPKWKDFLEKLWEASTVPKDRFDYLVSQNDYGLLASEITAHLNPIATEEIMRNIFRIRDTDIKARLKGPVQLLPLIHTQLVITTNYDNVLEIAYKNFDIHFEKALGSRIDDYAHLMRGNANVLMKLHGDLYIPRSRVLTKEEYDAVYIPEGDYVSTLKDIYRNNQLLFLGCSLDMDRTMDVFSDCGLPNRPHFALLPAPAIDGDNRDIANSVRERDVFLSSIGINAIWYTGQHSEAIQHFLIAILGAKGVI